MPGGVSSSYDDDLSVTAQQRFHRGCGIVEAPVFEIPLVLHVELSVPRPACDHDRACTNSQTASKDQSMQTIHLGCAYNVTRNGEVNPELERLEMATARQLRSRNAGRKSEVILNFRAGTGLSSRGIPFDHNRGQALRSCVDRSGKTCGTGSDDGDVIDRMRLRKFGNA